MIGVKATVLPWMRIFIVRFLCNCLYGKGDRICVANSRCLEVVQVSASHKVLRNGHIPKTIHTILLLHHTFLGHAVFCRYLIFLAVYRGSLDN